MSPGKENKAEFVQDVRVGHGEGGLEEWEGEVPGDLRGARGESDQKGTV